MADPSPAVELTTFPALEPLRLDHQAAIEAITTRFAPYSDFTFASLWCWDADGEVYIGRRGRTLVTRFPDYFTGRPVLSFVGDDDVAGTVRTLRAHATDGRLAYVPADLVNGVDLGDDVEVVPDRDNFDYVYDCAALAEMKGRDYQVVRNRINRFTRAHDWTARPLDIFGADADAIADVRDRWARAKVAGGMEVDVDLDAYARLPDLNGRVDLLGMGVFAGGELCGYTINELNQRATATNLFEHGDTGYPGVFKLLKRETAAALRDTGYRFWNHQQDSGFAGLRRSKTSYRPAHFQRKVSLVSRS